MTDFVSLLQNPLLTSATNSRGPYLRLVLAEAANYGMPPQVVACLDDLASMLGFYDPMPANAAAHLAGPLIQWHTPGPVLDRIVEVEALAMKQRALIAFGGIAPGHMVGTAELVCAMGNFEKDQLPSQAMQRYFELFQWASTDVWATLLEKPREVVRREFKYPLIIDEEVLKPGGRLHPTYVELATEIRRSAITALENHPHHPRNYLKPLAQAFLSNHERMLKAACDHNLTSTVRQLQETIDVVRRMYPDLVETTEQPGTGVDQIDKPAP
jgi:hypothetical protein